MIIVGKVQLGNGMIGVDVLEVASGLVSRHIIAEGGIRELMKDLRSK